MKLIHITALTACATLFMLSACGPSNDAGVTTAGGATDIKTTDASANRDWMPAAIVLPQPHTVVADRDLGLRTHLLQIVVQNDPTAEFAQWKSALSAAGYKVIYDTANSSLVFNGTEVEMGQIAVSQPEDHEGFMIQVDVSLRLNGTTVR